MKKLIVLCVAAVAALGSPASASTITVTAPTTVNSSFDVTVTAQDLFDGRDILTDIIISSGFQVDISTPGVFAFVGATSGPLFDTATTEPGTDVFSAAIGQSGFGIEPGATEPLILATLHFAVIGPGSANIVISSDLTNLFQGLQYFNAPFQEPIAGSVSVTARAAAVPEPSTLVLVGAGLAGLVRRFLTASKRR
jgi:hypothetical protein